MKRIYSFFFMLLPVTIFSQENKITEVLNKQLNKEIKEYEMQEGIKILQPFHIDANKKLVFEVEKYNPYMKQTERTLTEVALKDISGFVKDVNVLFETNGDKVTHTVKIYDEKKQLIRTDVSDTNLFFTEISQEKNNESLRKEMIKYFKKAGYIITSGYWYD